jgi:hypothetical protein
MKLVLIKRALIKENAYVADVLTLGRLVGDTN